MIVTLTSNKSIAYWKQERLIVRLSQTANVRMWSSLEGSYDSPIATYSVPTSGTLDVDVTDYVRTYISVSGYMYFKAENSNTTLTLTISVSGLINPADVIIPYRKLNKSNALGTYILPPHMMIEPILSTLTLTFEMASGYDGYAWTTARVYYIPSNTLVNAAQAITPTAGTTAIDLCHIDASTKYEHITFKKMQCNVNYAMVRWVSFTGITRVHTFEVVKAKTENANNYSLLPTDNEYIEVKGRVDSLVLRLAGLSAYDLWYYSDVLNSSKLEMTLDGTNWAQVQVTTKNVTLPDGEMNDGKLELNVNWKRYDAVAM